MSHFDIAIGIGETSVNTALSALFNNNTARAKYFQGTYSKDISGKGNVSLTYDVKAAPTVTLSPPSQAEWDSAIKQSSSTTMPAENLFQVHFPDISGSEAIDNGTPVNAEGKLDVYLTATMTPSQNKGVLSLDPVAVWIDTSSFSEFDEWFVTSILVPAALEMAGTMLGTIKLPEMPGYEGVSFNAPELSTISNQLVMAATMTTSTTPLSFDGFTVADKNYYALISPDTINAIASAGTASYVNKPMSGSDKTGNDMAWAKGSYNASLNSIFTQANPSDPTKVTVSVKADISVTGSAGGIGPALACPVGAALNAF